jgi:hypothetical protein
VASKIIASELLLESLQRHEIHLSLLVADTGLWANPEYHHRLARNTGHAAMFPKVRRARFGQGEQPNQVVDGVRLDSNNYANMAIKRAVGLTGGRAEGFEACHIWPLTCYDVRYHTAPANIVLLPRAIAGLSDHDAEIQAALQYRAFELYGWWPEDLPQPTKPDFYPTGWCEPQADPGTTHAPRRSESGPGLSPEETRRVRAERVVRWSKKPGLNAHKIIALVVQSEDGVPRVELVRRVAEATHSKNPYGAVASMTTDGGNGYGRIFVDVGGIIRLHPDVAEQVRSVRWTVEK